jgi:hypothetical protein
MVFQLRKELGTEHGTVKRVATQLVICICISRRTAPGGR